MAPAVRGLVVVLGDSCELGQATVAHLRTIGFSVLGVSRRSKDLAADLLTEAGLALLTQAVKKSNHTLKGVVNFIGEERGSGLPTDLNDEDWEQTWRGNVLPLIRSARALDSALAPDSRWINISTAQTRTPSAFNAHYSSAKAALESITRSLALSWASKGVKVTALRLGAIDTTKTRAKDHFDLERVKGRIALGSLGTTEDVALTVAFLLSTGSRWMTGHVLDLDGGTGLR